jgi:hypothetical protein
LIFNVADLLSISLTTVLQAEKSVAQQLFFVLEQGAKTTELDEASKSAVEERADAGKLRRWAGIGAGFLAGGIAIGVTGGSVWFGISSSKRTGKT